MQAKWNRNRAAHQPTKRKQAQFDKQNERAASAILEAPEQHPRFMQAGIPAATGRRNSSAKFAPAKEKM